MKIGFTGTQEGMTQYQRNAVAEILALKKPEFGVHGDCIGADKDFHDLCVAQGIKIEIHPPDKDIKRAFCNADVIKKPLPYLLRNHNIVDAVDYMIATPKTSHEELRSGTWATIRYARKKNKRIIVLRPEA